uniref:ABC transporter domain-containing protein n=1 Tax=Haptolina ericina TaxID=156174 RepID=A0A7S3AUG8_9EUKA
MQQFVDKFRANANRAKMVQSRIKALSKMENVAEILADPSLTFNFPSPEPLSAPILQLTDVTFGYPGRDPLFRQVNLGIDMTSRVSLVGPNGVGKSTLLKVILGDLEATSGHVSRSSRLRMGRFSQHHVDQLELDLTPLEAFAKQYPNAKPLEIRSHLGKMGLGGNLALQKMRTLSGGQKSRVAFAQIMWQEPHVLLLDEPTNHLDLDAVEALIMAIMDFDGGVLVISHDEHLVSSICEELWVAEPGRVSIFRGPFADYRKQQLALAKRQGLQPLQPNGASAKKAAAVTSAAGGAKR